MVPDWLKNGDFGAATHTSSILDNAFKRAKYLHCFKKYESMLAVAQTALWFSNAIQGIIISDIYLRVTCAVACYELNHPDAAKQDVRDLPKAVHIRQKRASEIHPLKKLHHLITNQPNVPKLFSPPGTTACKAIFGKYIEIFINKMEKFAPPYERIQHTRIYIIIRPFTLAKYCRVLMETLIYEHDLLRHLLLADSYNLTHSDPPVPSLHKTSYPFSMDISSVSVIIIPFSQEPLTGISFL